MKFKVMVVGLIGLLLAGGLILTGCDWEKCPDDKNCSVDFTGNGIGATPTVHSRTNCSSSDCSVNKSFSASAGHRTQISCRGCKI